MDKDTQTPISETAEFEPPKEQLVSGVVGNALNGGTLGIASSLGLEKLGMTVNNKKQFVVFATVIGCAVGGLYGIYEGKRMHEYRSDVNDELKRLGHEVKSHTQQINEWSKKEDARKKEAAPAEAVRS